MSENCSIWYLKHFWTVKFICKHPILKDSHVVLGSLSRDILVKKSKHNPPFSHNRSIFYLNMIYKEKWHNLTRGFVFFQQEQPVVEAFFECTFARFELNARRERQENPTTERYSSIHYCHLSLIVFISCFQYTRRSSHRPISQGSPAKPFTGSDAKTHATSAGGWSPLTWWFSMGIPFNKPLLLITKTLSKANTPVVFGFLNDQLDFYMFLYLHIKVNVFTCECDVCIHDILCL